LKEKLTVTIDQDLRRELDKIRGIVPLSTWVNDRLWKAIKKECST